MVPIIIYFICEPLDHATVNVSLIQCSLVIVAMVMLIISGGMVTLIISCLESFFIGQGREFNLGIQREEIQSSATGNSPDADYPSSFI